ncbi:MAG: hypothetical protein P8M80_06995 [Pirellulaceae bacterium]|jgi:hypothetical protein|nr:hypothetical protein [Mariniblastus sp.]MDB4671493.1 hypothetical protein [Pirellulaceae bacterium]MDB4756442.1 hypothetical protein [Mariniblastus sp.]MDG2469008.1 hypothetical protein [Pirellulaceae bacterium]
MPNAWICPECEKWIDEPFDVCWHCGTGMDGTKNPDFGRESDAADLDEDPEVPRIKCVGCQYQGKVLFSSLKKSLLDWVLAGLISMMVSQRSWIQFCEKICPKCGASEDQHRAWSGEIIDEDHQIWLSQSLREEQQAKTNRRSVYFLVASVLISVAVLYAAMRGF